MEIIISEDVTAYIDRAAAGKLTMVEYFDWVQAKGPGAPKQ